MGKDKQRTKGGVKPCSSGRTAELLLKSQNVSFENQSVFSNYVPVITFGFGDFDGQDSTLSPDLRLLLRKLGKKDSTTKIKALGELADLCSQNEEACSDVLPYWPRIYSRLTADDSRKVRELCHGVLEVIGKTVGRNLAPHLKSIAPYWLLAQNDIFAPASSTASNAFKVVFPTDKKQKEAILYCREETIALIIENLSVGSSQTKLGDQKKQSTDGDKESDCTDFETYAVRMAYASLITLSKLIELNVIDEANCQILMDSNSFWSLTKHPSSSVRRQLFNLITSIANWKPALIQRQCIKAITQALRDETSDCLQSLWNCFLTLTLNCDVFTTDPNLTKLQLLKVCRKGFYGNASSLGPAVLPLVAKIGLDEDLITQLLPALQAGFLTERSTAEKSAVLRAYGEALAFYIRSCPSSSLYKLLDESVFPFIGTLITLGSARDFASCLGSLIKKDEFFIHLSDMLAGDDAEKWNTKECGYFIVSLCSDDVAEPAKKLKSVKFVVNNITVSSKAVDYNQLPNSKKSLVKRVAAKSLNSSCLNLFSVLSSSFQCDTFYKDITNSKPSYVIESAAFQESVDDEVRLSLVLDLIKTFPTSPAFLCKLSILFESQSSNLSQLVTFISRLNKFLSIPCLKLWLKQDIFCEKVQDLITKSEYLGDEDALGVLRFILENKPIFGSDFVDNTVDVICTQVSSCQSVENPFLTKVLRLIKRIIDQQEAGAVDSWRKVILQIWERLVHFAVSVNESNTEEKQHVDYLIDEFLGIIPPVGVIRDDVYHILQQEVDNTKSIKEIDTLLRLTTSVMGPTENIQLTPILSLRFDTAKTEDLLNFVGLSYSPLKNSALSSSYQIVKEQLRTGFLARTIYEARLAMKCNNIEEIVDFVSPLLKVFYAQSVCIFWRELEKFDNDKALKEDLADELGILSSRWLEIIASNKWNRWREEILDELLKSNRDVLLSSKIPLQLFLQSTKKMELALTFLGRSKSLQQFILEDSVALDSEKVLSFLEAVIRNYFMEDQVHDITPVIDYLTLQRKNYAEYFNFEKLFSHVEIEMKQTMLAILEIVILLLRRIIGGVDNEDFYSTATCWISAWLKQCKNLPSVSELDKLSLLWINKLATATALIANQARNVPDFATEYVEFHASNLYLPLHYLFLQLGSLKSTDFIVVRTAELVGVALSSVPAPTLSFIEPVPAKICTNFTPFLEDDRTAIKILAYRIIKKVKTTASSGLESEDLPIVPTELNELIRSRGETISGMEITSLDDPNVLTYLLSWDALLSMHSDRSCNEFGNFSKEPHLLPQLLSILFFQLIDLIPDAKFNAYFESSPVLVPDMIPPPYGHLVCSVLLKALTCLPYPTRWWWNTQLSKQRDKSMVEKFIVRYLTSKLAADELLRVKWEESDNITVHALPGCNELIAHYKFEDTTVSLTISLPLNHPLGPIAVKISDKKLLGRITNLLNNRSNSLAAGLKMWKENLDAKFSGHEECAICFFIVHSATKSLPKMVCKTCSHKFHSACLLKWFSTSNKSECPLCRNLF